VRLHVYVYVSLRKLRFVSIVLIYN